MPNQHVPFSIEAKRLLKDYIEEKVVEVVITEPEGNNFDKQPNSF